MYEVLGKVRKPRSAVQSQKAVSAHFTSEQIMPFGFAEVLSVWKSDTSDNLEKNITKPTGFL